MRPNGSKFASAMTNRAKQIKKNEKTSTENGALAYKSTGKDLLDLNFKIPELRHMPELDLISAWKKCFKDDPTIALRWLFYLRDIRGGMGEKRAFDVIFRALNPKLQAKLISYRVIFGNGQNSESVPIVPHYGAWKELFRWFTDKSPEEVKKAILETMKFQLQLDLAGIAEGRSISFMGKYMPSISASNSQRRHNARVFAKYLHMEQKEYQQMVTAMLEYLKVPEQMMSRRQWGSIEYERVPSIAMNLYSKKCFRRRDKERFEAYIEGLKSGKSKVQAKTLYPYQVFSSMRAALGLYDEIRPSDKELDKDLIQAQWKALPPFISEDRSVMFILDTSSSMTWYHPIPSQPRIESFDVAASLTIKGSESLKGPYKDKFIVFSSVPRIIDIGHLDTLEEKINHIWDNSEFSNTDVARSMDLILDIALENHLTQEDLPTDLVILSDMQFDAIFYPRGADKTLFENIERKFRRYGYTMPRVTFWNVRDEAKAVPMQHSPGGVCLLSGFSINNYKIIATGEKDPYEALKATIMDKRYDPVEDAYNEFRNENGWNLKYEKRSRGKVPTQEDNRRAVINALEKLKGDN